MAVTNFIPSVWEARLIEKFHARSVAKAITVPPTKIEGNKIIYNVVSDIAVKDYSGTVTFDELTTPKREINMDQKKYWAFKVGDVDKVQAAGELIDPHVREAGAVLQETADKFVLGLYASAHADNKLGTQESPIEVDKTNIYDTIVDINKKLDKKRVPRSGRFITINADILGMLEKDDRFTRNYTVLENGILDGAKINGAQIVLSEDVDTASDVIKVIANHNTAIGYGEQLQETEALRLESDFADGVRGLAVYGGQVLRPEGVAVGFLKIKTTP